MLKRMGVYYNSYFLSIPSFTQKGESALTLAVRQNRTNVYWLMMSEPPKTGVVSQLVGAGAALDLQNKVTIVTIVHLYTCGNHSYVCLSIKSI